MALEAISVSGRLLKGVKRIVVSLGIIYIFAPCFIRAVCRSV